MVNVVKSERNVYEDFDLESDVLYFKTGVQGLVSFHGRNYNIKKRMTAEQLQQLTTERGFFQISSNCYVNIAKIKSIADGTIYFGSDIAESKRVTVNRRKQYVIQQLFSQRSSNKDLRITP
ncbi:LytTR family transcriptional regulator DNA-binding domain-containing protein [Paenibacillus arenilitoris]|uniref:LytTR family transcriptional regulator DNA-binding domain-containing protein n=1 Tax=Paenibacillus arenilitoris TaxID=2772299 RepID=A0A927CGY2_9BACL|nr:LytTR family transcriptional regulator DNA-binding domain-containing protein [Paenibacillus arenilitoris]MBD2867899.1 LytTR family transcriptional regulator DNA-binding domain-containing protein [Paenibacillus arenilitoris]